MTAIFFKGARVIDPASRTDRVADVAVEGGLVRAIGPGLTPHAGAETIDCRNLILCPGLIDPHVHLREPGGEHKETIATGAAAAVEGGFTTVCCMPNTSPALDAPEIVEFIARRAEQAAAAHPSGATARVFSVAAATKGRKGEELAEIHLLTRAGAVGFSDDGDCIASAGMMARALTTIKPTRLAFMQHCQEPTLTKGSVMNSGALATRLGLTGWPAVAEDLIIERDVRLNRTIGCRYHVQHLSTAGAAEIVRRARADGQPVTAEASPHHLLLTEDACAGYDTRAKMNPPLRTQKDVDALRAAVADGTITVLATDHAPHTEDEKSQPFDTAPFGIIGLETALALYAEALIHTNLIDWPRMIELMTINAARLCNLDQRGLGTLNVNGPADITVIDPDARWTISANDLKGKCRNTPFLGRHVRGRAVLTMVNGRIAMRRA